MRRTLFALSALPLLAAAITFTSGEAPPRLDEARLVDLTHAFDERTIYWPTAKPFTWEKEAWGRSSGGYWYTAARYSASEHGGTHLDAPIHFAEGKNTIDQIPVDQLIGPGIIIDVTEQCASNRDYLVSVEDFEKWEQTLGNIPEGAIVLLRTGFGKFWPDREQYMGTAERGDSAVKQLHFPGLHPDAAKWVVANGKIKAIGLDTPSIDYGQSTGFESHIELQGLDALLDLSFGLTRL